MTKAPSVGRCSKNLCESYRIWRRAIDRLCEKRRSYSLNVTQEKTTMKKPLPIGVVRVLLGGVIMIAVGDGGQAAAGNAGARVNGGEIEHGKRVPLWCCG